VLDLGEQGHSDDAGERATLATPASPSPATPASPAPVSPSPARLVAGLDRLGKLLVRGRSVALLLSGERLRSVIGRVAAVRVVLEREAWLAVGRDLVGQRVRATVARHRWALAGSSATLDLWFAEGRRIDALLPPLAAPLPLAPAFPEPGVVAAPLAIPTPLIVPELEERPALRVLSA
jgi:hypothetical protein